MDTQQAKDIFREADTLFLQGNYAESLAQLEKLDALYPKQQNIMYPRAKCLLKLDRADEALALCDEMIDLFQLSKARNLKVQIISELGGGAKVEDAVDFLGFDAPEVGSTALADDFAPAVGDAGAQPWGRTVLVSAIVLASLAAGYYWLFLRGPG